MGKAGDVRRGEGRGALGIVAVGINILVWNTRSYIDVIHYNVGAAILFTVQCNCLRNTGRSTNVTECHIAHLYALHAP